ncbi:MAG: hypothetical protein V2A34_00285, partial [Lentisphaerota bacterium]
MTGWLACIFASISGFGLGHILDYQQRMGEVYRKNENQAASLQSVIREMETLNQELGCRVDERTAELGRMNKELQKEIVERKNMAIELQREKEEAETANRMKTE